MTFVAERSSETSTVEENNCSRRAHCGRVRTNVAMQKRIAGRKSAKKLQANILEGNRRMLKLKPLVGGLLQIKDGRF
jgi:hypothetical protein